MIRLHYTLGFTSKPKPIHRSSKTQKSIHPLLNVVHCSVCVLLGGHGERLALGVAGAVQPRVGGGAGQLEGGDLVTLLQGQPDVVQAVDQAVLAELVHLERDGASVRALDDLVGQVHLQLAACAGVAHQLAHLRLRQYDGQHAVLEAVVEEDVGEGRADHAADAEVVDGPRRVLARRPAPEVGTRDEDLGLAVARLVQHKLRALLAVLVEAHLVEGAHSQPGALDGLEELLGDDHVCVDVLQVHRGSLALEGGEHGHALRAGAGARLALDRRRGDDEVVAEEALGVRGGHVVARQARAGAHLAHVRELAADGRRRRHRRRHQVRAPAVALAPLEVAVGGGGAALLGQQLVGVHRQAHGAPGLAPVEPRRLEHHVQALRLRLLLHDAGARHHHGVHRGRHLLAARHGSHGADVLDAAVGAGADEHLVHGHVLHLGARGQAHVRQRALHGRHALRIGGEVRGVGHHAGDGHHVLRGGAPRHGGLNVRPLDDHLLVVRGVVVRGQRPPIRHRLVPGRAAGRHGAALEVVEGDLVGGDEAGAGAALDGHVADGHARLHGQRLDGVAGKLNHGPGAAGGADHADHVQDEVLGRHAVHEGSVHLDAHVLVALLQQRLRGQHVLHLGRADAERQRAERAVRGGVGVAAHHSGAGQREALLGADDVHDALALVAQPKVRQPELLHVLLQRQHLQTRVRLLDEVLHGVEGAAVRGGHVVVHRHQRAVRAPHDAVCGAQALERLRGGDLVHHVAVDVDEARAVLLFVHHVVRHDLVVHRLARGHNAGGGFARAGGGDAGEASGLGGDRCAAGEAAGGGGAGGAGGGGGGGGHHRRVRVSETGC
mmetsp:Transcript_32545/g.80233  ORF Transcript_32545/g.80233 Transcript_32545/m.80233 type:complete len:833 (+) Transcript_32545:138-2636(+)